MKQQERSSQVKEVVTCYTGSDMKTGTEVLTRKMMSRPPFRSQPREEFRRRKGCRDLENRLKERGRNLKKRDGKKIMSRHHHDVAT